MKKTLVRLLVLPAAALALAGCDTKGCRSDNSSGLPSASALPQPIYGAANVAGRVTFDGTPPEPEVIGTGDGCGHGGEVVSEQVVVGDDGGLANVLVYLDGSPPSTGDARDDALLDQENCRFEPHVLGVQVGQPLVVKNSDPMRHNVHWKAERNPDANVAFETGGRSETVDFARPEPRPVRVKCDVHPWMTAYLGVFAHPFFATTDPDGRYAIDRVPAGEYELVAWHELYGERREPIVVADAGDVAADFAYARPQ